MDVLASTRANSTVPAPTMNGPTVIGSRGPMRCARAPIRAENASISTVIGISAAPASSAE